MVVTEANNPRTSPDLTHQRNRGDARALANNPKATDTTEHRATRVLQRNRPIPAVKARHPQRTFDPHSWVGWISHLAGCVARVSGSISQCARASSAISKQKASVNWLPGTAA